PGLQHFQTTLAMIYNGQTFNVPIEVSLNPATGLLTAVFQSIDPSTSLPPDVLTGFLPPEDGTGRGMAHFSYSVAPKPGLPTGTAQQTASFTGLEGHSYGFYSVATDHVGNRQATPATPQAGTTVDATPPTSSVTALAAVTPSASFTVSWSGSDNAGGSGIAS